MSKVSELDLKKYYTKEVEIYEKIKNLDHKVKELMTMKDFIESNYDSYVNVTIEASSHHNYNMKTNRTISLPVEVVLEVPITKELVLKRIEAEIKNIMEKELLELSLAFDELRK